MIDRQASSKVLRHPQQLVKKALLTVHAHTEIRMLGITFELISLPKSVLHETPASVFEGAQTPPTAGQNGSPHSPCTHGNPHARNLF